MSRPTEDGRLLDVVPQFRDVEQMLTAHRIRRDELRRQLGRVERHIERLTALAHALRRLVNDPAASAVAARLAENGWSGTGDELVDTVRAVLGQATPS